MIKTDRSTAVDVLDNLRESGVSDTQILEYILYNNLSGEKAKQVMLDASEEFEVDVEG